MNFEQKYDFLRGLAKTYKVEAFVETGTYQGRMTDAMATHVSKIRTIELSPTLHAAAEALFAARADKDIKVLLGNSGEVLAEVLKEDGLGLPLIWLDAHWSAGNTAWISESKHTPVVDELQTIADSGVRAVVAIDDIRCFDGKNGYPSFEKLREIVHRLWPDATMTREDDAVWFVTSSCP